MKILLVGSNLQMAIERHYVKYLAALGAEIYHYPAPDIWFAHMSKNLINRALYKTNLHTGYGSINKELLKIATRFRPDIIWVVKGMELYPETIRKLAMDFKLANYNPDHPFIIVSRGSGNSNVTDSVPYYQLHFCYNRLLQNDIEMRFGSKTVFLPFAYDMNVADFEAASKFEEINRLCFLGNPDETREQVVLQLAKAGYPVDIYGHGWYKTGAAKNPLIQVHDAVYGLAFWEKLRQYRVQVNIFRKHNIGSHNMRSFEIPAIGGIELSPFSEEQEQFFTAGKEIFYYRSYSDMASQAGNLLQMDTSAANNIRDQARARSLTPGYTYADRAATVYETFKKMMAW